MASSDLGGFYTAQKAREIAKGGGGASNDVLTEIQRIQLAIDEAAKGGNNEVTISSPFGAFNSVIYNQAYNNDSGNKILRSNINDVIGYFSRLGYNIQLSGGNNARSTSGTGEDLVPFFYSSSSRDTGTRLTSIGDVKLQGAVNTLNFTPPIFEDRIYDIFVSRQSVSVNGIDLEPASEIIIGGTSEATFSVLTTSSVPPLSELNTWLIFTSDDKNPTESGGEITYDTGDVWKHDANGLFSKPDSSVSNPTTLIIKIPTNFLDAIPGRRFILEPEGDESERIIFADDRWTQLTDRNVKTYVTDNGLNVSNRIDLNIGEYWIYNKEITGSILSPNTTGFKWYKYDEAGTILPDLSYIGGRNPIMPQRTEPTLNAALNRFDVYHQAVNVPAGSTSIRITTPNSTSSSSSPFQWQIEW